MTEYCRTCKRTPLVYAGELDFGDCYDCQERAIAKYERMRDWAEFHGEWHDELDDALAAATGTAETSGTSAQCEASQSGGEAVTSNRNGEAA